MLRFVPGFILDGSASQGDAGSFTGYVLFADIAGFTDLSNVFRKEGKKGAEALHHYLAAALSTPIDTVEKYGGFISHFAGDAFCAVFPDAGTEQVKHVVKAIGQYLDNHGSCHTEIGDFPLKLRISVSAGMLDWVIYRNEMQCEYVFSGKPLQELAALAAQKKELALSDAVAKAFNAAGSTEPMPSPLGYKANDADLSAFTNARIISEKPDNEIRDGAYCFVNLSRLHKNKVGKALALIHAKLDNYGGFLNKLDAGDKGLVALILFGLPKALGNTLERACRFALETIAEIPELSLGLSCGTAYTGYVGSDTTREYTALGAAVNLASRLMQKAGKGEILTDSYLEQELHYKYRFESAETLSLKGFAAPVHCHRLIERLPAPPQSFMAELVGRENELELIHQAVEAAGSQIMYISGEPGIGKSRLILEALKPYPKRYFLFCDPSGHKLLEPIKQFLRQYFAFDPLLSSEQNQNSFRAKWQELAGEDKELQRIESIVGDLLGFEWQGSIWSMLPPNERPEQQRKAFATLLARITEKEKILIHLDDPQWLDATDTEYFRQLGSAKLVGIVIIAACRYLEDGNKVDLEIPNWEAKHLDLNRLSEDAAAKLIRHLHKVDALPPETQGWIVKKADGNPLFIEQVVAYLRENGCFDQDYRLKGNLDYLSSFGIADIIGSRIDSLTEAVRNTLQHACVLGLEFNTRVLSEMLSRKLDDDLGEGKQARVWADIDELRYIFTHVLIKDTAYNRMLSDKLKTLHLLAAETMERMYRDDEKALNEHAEEIAGHYENAGLEEKAAEYYDKAGCWYREKYDWEKSEASLKKAVNIREKVFGVEHPDTATSLDNLALTYKACGKYKQAESIFNQILTIRERVLGPEHIDTAISANNLAYLYVNQGKYEQAEPLYKRALIIRDQTLGPEHPDTAATLNNLATLYNDQGKYAQAESLYLRALAINEKTLGAEHPITATTLNNLASLYNDQCKYVQAESLYLRALDISKRALGSEHPSTSISLNNLAYLYTIQNKYAQAEPLFLQVLAIREKTLGIQHPSTETSINNLASLYTAQGKYTQAEPLFLRALEIREKVLGSEHPDIAISLNNLASLYTKQIKYTQAESLYLRALSIKEKILGTEHPSTANSLSNLAYLYEYQGKYAESESLNLQALEIREKVLGSEHPDIAISLNNLASLYTTQEKYEQALPLYIRALKIREKINGREHEDTQKTIQGLVETYEKLNQPDKAAEYRAMLLSTTEG